MRVKARDVTLWVEVAFDRKVPSAVIDKVVDGDQIVHEYVFVHLRVFSCAREERSMTRICGKSEARTHLTCRTPWYYSWSVTKLNRLQTSLLRFLTNRLKRMPICSVSKKNPLSRMLEPRTPHLHTVTSVTFISPLLNDCVSWQAISSYKRGCYKAPTGVSRWFTSNHLWYINMFWTTV